MDDVLALIMAGGEGHRLSILAEERAKPAVPFAGAYRIIDFTISNCVRSGINRVGVLTQYRPGSLTAHIGLGRPWDLDREGSSLSLLQPHTRRHSRGWYLGTADAVYQNLSFVDDHRAEQVLILGGDHIYTMQYNDMVAFHRAKKADVTIAVIEVPWDEASRFGLATLDQNDAVVAYEEKPSHPRTRLASMGLYIFTTQVLKEVLEEDAQKEDSTHDFGRDLLPVMVGSYAVFGFRFSDYWRDVGTLESYWQANREFLQDPPPLNLDQPEQRVRTRSQERAPAYVGPEALVQRSLLCHGSSVHGTVRSSILSPGVRVEAGARVEDSILFDDVLIKKGAVVHRSMVDKEVVVGEGAIVGYGDDNTPNRDDPETLYAGFTLVGKRAVVPSGVRLGRNCKVVAGATEEDFPPLVLIPSGSTVEKGARRVAAADFPAVP